MKQLKQQLHKGERLLGTLVSIAAPQVSEILWQAGFDWLFIDGEHSSLSDGQIQQLIQAAAPCPVLCVSTALTKLL